MKIKLNDSLKIKYLYIGFVMYFCLSFNATLKAQKIDSTSIANLEIDTLNNIMINLKDGGIVKGYFVSLTNKEINIQSEAIGIVTIKLTNILRIKKIYYNENPDNGIDKNEDNNLVNDNIEEYRKPLDYDVTHKYYWNNNYMGIKKNELIYQNIGILYNGIDYGISDNFSIGGGLLFAGIVGFVNIHFRSQVEVAENFNVGVAYNYFVATSIYNNFSSNSSSEKIGFLSGGFTYGNEKANISLGVGRFNSNEESLLNNKNELGFSVSGSVKISTNTSIVSDNLIWSNELNLYCLGFRLNSSKSCYDFGLMNFRTFNSYGSNSTFIPYLALNYKIK